MTMNTRDLDAIVVGREKGVHAVGWIGEERVELVGPHPRSMPDARALRQI